MFLKSLQNGSLVILMVAYATQVNAGRVRTGDRRKRYVVTARRRRPDGKGGTTTRGKGRPGDGNGFCRVTDPINRPRSLNREVSAVTSEKRWRGNAVPGVDGRPATKFSRRVLLTRRGRDPDAGNFRPRRPVRDRIVWYEKHRDGSGIYRPARIRRG